MLFCITERTTVVYSIGERRMTNHGQKLPQKKVFPKAYVYDFKDFDFFHEFCEIGSSMDILTLVKTNGYDRKFMTTNFFRKVGSPIPVNPVTHPLYVACKARNLPVIIILMELGTDPDLPIHPWDTKTIRKEFANDKEISSLFIGHPCWWLQTYSQQQQLTLQDEFISSFRQHEYPVIIWHLLRGMYLESPEILAEDSFATFPRTMKDIVCHTGIHHEKIKKYYYWLQEHTSCQDTIASMESAASRKHDVMDIALENIRLSLDLMDYDSLFDVIQSTLPLEEQVLLLKWLAERYDMTGNKEILYNIFMETLKNILYSLVP